MPRIDRDGLAVLISGMSASSILDTRTRQSAVLSTFPQITMPKNTYSQPMLASEPTAGFVTENTDATGIKPQTTMSFSAKSMTTAEVATIAIISDNLLADVDSAALVESTLRDKVTGAFAKVIDDAILFGVNTPAQWTDVATGGIVGKAVAASNRIQNPTGTTNQVDLPEQFNRLLGLVEEDGFNVTDLWAVNSLKARLRGLRDSTGAPVYLSEYRADGNTSSVYGYPLTYLDPRVVAGQAVEAVALDRSQYLVGIRQDISVSVSNQATLTGFGNLWERDHTAFRFVFRLAFGQFTPPLQVGTNPYPAAVLAPKVP